MVIFFRLDQKHRLWIAPKVERIMFVASLATDGFSILELIHNQWVQCMGPVYEENKIY